MRVLAMVHAYPPAHNAGAEMTIQAVLEELAQRGHSVDVQLSSPTPLGDYTRNKVAVRAPRGTADPFVHINAGVDVIITHLENTYRAAAIGSLYDIPVVHVLHNTDTFGKDRLSEGRADLAVFNTDWMREDYAEWFRLRGFELPPHVTMHPAVYADDYKAVKPKPEYITLINLWDGKGGELFWELARRMPDRKFAGVHGAYGEQVIDDLPNATVLAHAAPEQMPAIYAKTKILLMPSAYESYGRVGVEAAVNGIPVIAHPTPGIREALGDDATYCDRDDPDAWVAAIKKLTSPRGYAAARKKALAIADRQRPAEDLEIVCNWIEEAGRGRLAPARRAG